MTFIKVHRSTKEALVEGYQHYQQRDSKVAEEILPQIDEALRISLGL